MLKKEQFMLSTLGLQLRKFGCT